MSTYLNSNRPLPNCDGPKLSPFKDDEPTILFRRLLSDNKLSPSNGHAHVFDVTINSVPYALKIFKFYDHKVDGPQLSAADKKKYTIEVVCAHDDPFYRECRAYGKIIEANLNGKVAVRCHGYLMISATLEDELKRNFKVAVWDRPDDEYEVPLSQRQPLRAVVKDLVLSDVEFTKKDVIRMLKSLKQIRNLEIYPMDVAARNYRGGLLVDFSAAITEPHYFFNTRPKSVYKSKREDLIQFDKMIEEAGIEFPASRALPNKQYKGKLRQHEKEKAKAS